MMKDKNMITKFMSSNNLNKGILLCHDTGTDKSFASIRIAAKIRKERLHWRTDAIPQANSPMILRLTDAVFPIASQVLAEIGCLGCGGHLVGDPQQGQAAVFGQQRQVAQGHNQEVC